MQGVWVRLGDLHGHDGAADPQGALHAVARCCSELSSGFSLPGRRCIQMPAPARWPGLCSITLVPCLPAPDDALTLTMCSPGSWIDAVHAHILAFRWIPQLPIPSVHVAAGVRAGNHERDWPGTGTRFDLTYPPTHDSGGECGVVYARRFPMPQPGPDLMWCAAGDFGAVKCSWIVQSYRESC